jgi:hypothetical protein
MFYETTSFHFYKVNLLCTANKHFVFQLSTKNRLCLGTFLAGSVENIDVGRYMALSLDLLGNITNIVNITFQCCCCCADEEASETEALAASPLDVHANGMNRNLTHTMRRRAVHDDE